MVNELTFFRWLLTFILYLSVFSLHAISLPSMTDLSLEEKVGQLLMVHFHGEEANEEARRLIQELHVGGIIYYTWANELSDPQQVQCLSVGLQELAQKNFHALPLLIAIDQEGGPVNRLKKGFTLFPSNYAFGLNGNSFWCEKASKIIGQELKAVGISLNLAPVLDVYTQSANPALGIRSFSSDPKQVSLLGSCALKGYRQAGISAVLKHFPGHGDVVVDSHQALPIIAKSREKLEQVELVPFRALVGKSDVVMTGHLMVPSLDSEHCVTFSKRIVENLLRKEMGFQGVIMTDSFAMKGILDQCQVIEEGILQSLDAGHDLILLGGKQLLASQAGLEFSFVDIQRIHTFLVEAVKSGRLSEKKLDESVTRLLSLKQKVGLFDTPTSNFSLNQVGSLENKFFALHVAQTALKLIKGKELLPLSFQKPLLIVAPELLKKEIEQTSWNFLETLFYQDLDPDQTMIQKIQELTANNTQCVFFSYNAWQFEGQQKLFHLLRQKMPLLVTVVTRDPEDVSYLQTTDILLCTFGPVACSFQATFDYFIGKKQ